MFTFYKNSQKGQDLVEYALMLAIVIGIGWGIYSQTGVADSIKNVFGNASSLMEAVKKDKEPFDMEAVLNGSHSYIHFPDDILIHQTAVFLQLLR